MSDEDNAMYSIKDIQGLCSSIRKNVAKDLTGEKIVHMTDLDLNEFITIQQIKNIIMDHCIIDDDDILLNTEIYAKILEEVSSDMYGAALSKLAASDKIDVAWDDELNEMIFLFK